MLMISCRIFRTTLAALAFGVTGNALAATVSLPDPTSTIDGLPAAVRYDDFYSYSAGLLDEWQNAGFLPISTYGDWGTYIAGVGTGTLDVLLTTRSSGVKNEDVGADGPDSGTKGDFNFEEPTVNPAVGTPTKPGNIDVWWGQNDQLNDGPPSGVGKDQSLDHSPVTVGALLAYMTATFGPDATIPVFTFDQNQTGASDDLFVVARVALLDPVTREIMAFWAFDNIDNAAFDCPGAPSTMSGGTYGCGTDTGDPWWVLSPGVIQATGASGTEYDIQNNLGSGSTDFVVYAPGMDLRNYNPSWIFMTEVHYIGANDGGEELYLTGAIATFDTPVPATLPLLGGGLLALGGLRQWRLRRLAQPTTAGRS